MTIKTQNKNKNGNDNNTSKDMAQRFSSPKLVFCSALKCVDIKKKLKTII